MQSRGRRLFILCLFIVAFVCSFFFGRGSTCQRAEVKGPKKLVVIVLLWALLLTIDVWCTHANRLMTHARMISTAAVLLVLHINNDMYEYLVPGISVTCTAVHQALASFASATHTTVVGFTVDDPHKVFSIAHHFLYTQLVCLTGTRPAFMWIRKSSRGDPTPRSHRVA